MRIPFSWLQSFFSSKLDPVQVADKLTGAGLEVEEIIKPNPFGKFVVVGLVESVEKHPNADSLHITKVRVSKGEVRTIVCGAKNVAVGQKVPVALPGATLPNGMTIGEATIRGQKSAGMICAEDELGIGSSHDGILVLPEDARLGVTVDSLHLQDTILEAEVTPNRPDWLSLVGVARELGAVTNQKFILPALGPVKASKSSFSFSIKLDKGAAHQYFALHCEKYLPTETPLWMRSRLRSFGVVPQNAIVDVTNYILFELGQPLHAFDAKKIRGKQIRVRFAKPQERITLLDGKTYTLEPNDIVIADAKSPIALAGIMGGLDSAVSKSTENVVIERALFPMTNIRKTARRLGLSTEASYRFERGVSPDLGALALRRAAVLFRDLKTFERIGGTSSRVVYTATPKKISVSVARICRLLGVKLQATAVMSLLERLSLQVNKKGRDTLVVKVPLYRQDIQREEDVAEEVARMYGYANIRPTLPASTSGVPQVDPMFRFTKQIRDELYALGYSELYRHSFYGKQNVKHALLPVSEHRIVVNPLNVEQEYLRTDLLPGLFDAVSLQRKKRANMKVFEIGQVFWRHMKPGEHEWRLSLAVSLNSAGSWVTAQHDFTELLVKVLHIDEQEIYLGAGSHTRDIRIGANPIGYLSLRASKKGVIACCECSLAELLAHKKTPRFHPRPKFPAVNRDIAVLVPATVDWFTLLRQLYRGSSILKSAKLFDVHPQGTAISYAFHLTFQSDVETLETGRIETEMTSLARLLQQKGGLVRS